MRIRTIVWFSQCCVDGNYDNGYDCGHDEDHIYAYVYADNRILVARVRVRVSR